MQLDVYLLNKRAKSTSLKL